MLLIDSFFGTGPPFFWSKSRCSMVPYFAYLVRDRALPPAKSRFLSLRKWCGRPRLGQYLTDIYGKSWFLLPRKYCDRPCLFGPIIEHYLRLNLGFCCPDDGAVDGHVLDLIRGQILVFIATKMVRSTLSFWVIFWVQFTLKSGFLVYRKLRGRL